MQLDDDGDGENDDEPPGKHIIVKSTASHSLKKSLLSLNSPNNWSQLETFNQTNAFVTSTALCNAGFTKSSSEEDDHAIECNWCYLKLKNFNSSHNPLVWHRVYSPNCPFVKGQSTKYKNLKDTEFLTFAGDSDQVVLRQDLASSSSNLEDYLPSLSSSQTDDHITVLNDAAGDVEHGVTAAATTSEERTKLYKRLNQPRRVLPKSHIDVIKKPLAQIESLLSAFTYEKYRRLAFSNWPKKDTVSPRALAASGFVCLHDLKDTVECVFCKVHIGDWSADMVPDVVHRKKSKHCPLMKGSKTIRNFPDILGDIFDAEISPSNNPELGIIMESTKHPDFAVETRRKATFLTWPSANHKLASEMIEHALFYPGHGDVVCCFSCGIEMSGWTSTDNIWRRHARQAPHCQLVIQEKGADWVAATIEEHGRYQTEEREPAIITVTTRMLRPRMDNPATQQVLKLQNPSYPRDEVRSCLIQNIKYGRPDYMNRKDIVTAILKRREDRRQQEMVERSTSSEPAPPVVVSPPFIPRERATTIQDEETTSVQPPMIQENEHPNAAATITPATSSNATAMEDEPTAANIQRPTTPPAAAANPMDLARIMKAQLTCKICMDAPVGIAFLPCGHMVCCPSCAPAMVQCPLCRQDVRGTVRVYLDKL